MRRRDDKLRDTLLDYARQLAAGEGLDAINIRSIARMAGVSTGTVYNYFSSKEDILLDLTEEYWERTLLEMKSAIAAASFCIQVKEIYLFLRERIESSAGMLMRSLGDVEAGGRERMAAMQAELEAAMIRCIEQDADIRADIWDENFSKSQYARFIMMNLISMLKTGAPDIDFFVTIIERTIY